MENTEIRNYCPVLRTGSLSCLNCWCTGNAFLLFLWQEWFYGMSSPACCPNKRCNSIGSLGCCVYTFPHSALCGSGTWAAVLWVESGHRTVQKLIQQERKGSSRIISYSWLTGQVHVDDRASTKENSENCIKKGEGESVKGRRKIERRSLDLNGPLSWGTTS